MINSSLHKIKDQFDEPIPEDIMNEIIDFSEEWDRRSNDGLDKRFNI
jgi:hypothetical protein